MSLSAFRRALKSEKTIAIEGQQVSASGSEILKSESHLKLLYFLHRAFDSALRRPCMYSLPNHVKLNVCRPQHNLQVYTDRFFPDGLGGNGAVVYAPGGWETIHTIS